MLVIHNLLSYYKYLCVLLVIENLLICEFDGALHCGERDGAKVATGLPELDVLGAELLLAELLKVVATGHVVEEVGERARPATQLPVSGGLNTVKRGKIGEGVS